MALPSLPRARNRPAERAGAVPWAHGEPVSVKPGGRPEADSEQTGWTESEHEGARGPPPSLARAQATTRGGRGGRARGRSEPDQGSGSARCLRPRLLRHRWAGPRGTMPGKGAPQGDASTDGTASGRASRSRHPPIARPRPAADSEPSGRGVDGPRPRSRERCWRRSRLGTPPAGVAEESNVRAGRHEAVVPRRTGRVHRPRPGRPASHRPTDPVGAHVPRGEVSARALRRDDRPRPGVAKGSEPERRGCSPARSRGARRRGGEPRPEPGRSAGSTRACTTGR